MKKKNIVAILVGTAMIFTGVLVVTSMPAAVQASESVIFDDQFTSPPLGSDWVISPGRGNYSLTDNSGYLRYTIDAYHTNRTAGSGYAKVLWLVRPFSGDQWTLKTAVTYNMRPGTPTNNRTMSIDIYAPGGTGTPMARISRWVGVNDANPVSNAMFLSAGSNYQITYFPNSPNPLPLDRWYVEIERNENHVAVRASNDGNDSTFEYEVEYTFPPGFGNDQEIEIWGQGWYGSNNPPGYADFDFIKTTAIVLNQPPIANANGPYTGNEGSSITFDGSVSSDPDGTIISYEWDLNCDGQYDDATGVNPSYTWGDDYFGCIGLKVTDNDGLTDTDSTTVAVNNVAPTADAGADQTITAGDTVNFTGSMTDPGWLDTHTYEWDFDASDGTQVNATGQNPTYIYYQTGVYTVTLTVTDDNGGLETDTLQITANPIPTTIRIEPETLNLANRGEFTVFITLPEGYNVTDIDVSTVVCEGASAVRGMVFQEDSGTYIAKFNRQNLVNVFTGDMVTLIVTGKVFFNQGLADFEGSNTIRVINQGRR